MWISPTVCVILYLLFNGLVFLVIFKKKNKQYNEPLVKNKYN